MNKPLPARDRALLAIRTEVRILDHYVWSAKNNLEKARAILDKIIEEAREPEVEDE